MPQTKRSKAKAKRKAKKPAVPRALVPIRKDAHQMALRLARIEDRTLTAYLSRLVEDAAEAAGIVSNGKVKR